MQNIKGLFYCEDFDTVCIREGRKINMSTTEQLGEAVILGGFEVPDLTQEPPVERRTWYTVVLGAGTFATRAYSEDYAIFKAEIRAQELRNGKVPIESNGGFPLVIPMNSNEAAFRIATMYEGKSEAEIVSLKENTGTTLPVDMTQNKAPYNPDQGMLFDRYEFRN